MLTEEFAVHRPIRRTTAVSVLLLAMSISFSFPSRLGAQEIPRPSLAREYRQPQGPPDYNAKIGHVYLTLDAGVRATYTDNVFYSDANKASDFSINPQIGVDVTWPVTSANTLRLNTTIGYTKYLNHRELDSANLTLAPDSALTFDIYVGDFKIGLHDQFSIQQDPVGSGGSLSGIARLPRFTNTAGFNVLWDANDLIWTVGFDHYNFTTLGSATGVSDVDAATLASLDHTTDQISSSVKYQVTPVEFAGLEGTLSYSNYPNSSSANFSSFSAGPFVDAQLTHFTHLYLSGGFKGYSSNSGEPAAAGGSGGGGVTGGYYASAIFTHRLNHHYTDRLEIGHDDEADALSGRTAMNYVRYSSVWDINHSLSFVFGLFFEDTHESTGTPALGLAPADYRRFGCVVSTGYKLTEHVHVSLSYEFSKKDSTDPNQSYTQNQESIAFEYRF